MGPFDILEISAGNGEEVARLWARDGFPNSFLAADDQKSLCWRRDFIRSYLEREIPLFGPRVPA
jgi:predicted AAA+ superfamily ATPase